MHLTAVTLLCLCLATQALGFYGGRGIGYRRLYNRYNRYNRLRGQGRQAPAQAKPVNLPAKPVNLPAKPKQAVATPQPPSPVIPRVEPIHKLAIKPIQPKIQGLKKPAQPFNKPYDPVLTPFDPVYQPYEPTYDPTNLPFDPIYDQTYQPYDSTYDYLPYDLASRGAGNAKVIYVIKEDHPLPRGSASFNSQAQMDPSMMNAPAQMSPIEQRIVDIVGQFQQQLPTSINGQAQFQGNTMDQAIGSNVASMPAQSQAPANQAFMMDQAQPSPAPAQASQGAATSDATFSAPARADPVQSSAAPDAQAGLAGSADPAVSSDATAAAAPAPTGGAPVDPFSRMMRHQFISEMDLPPHMSAQMMNSGFFPSQSGAANMDPYFQMHLAEAMDFPNHPSFLPGFGQADATVMNGAPSAPATTKSQDVAPASGSAPASTATNNAPTNNGATPAEPTGASASANAMSSFDAAMDTAFAMGMAESMDLPPAFMLPGNNMGIF